MLQSTKKDLVRLVILSIMQKVKHSLSFENKPKKKDTCLKKFDNFSVFINVL